MTSAPAGYFFGAAAGTGAVAAAGVFVFGGETALPGGEWAPADSSGLEEGGVGVVAGAVAAIATGGA